MLWCHQLDVIMHTFFPKDLVAQSLDIDLNTISPPNSSFVEAVQQWRCTRSWNSSSTWIQHQFLSSTSNVLPFPLLLEAVRTCWPPTAKTLLGYQPQRSGGSKYDIHIPDESMMKLQISKLTQPTQILWARNIDPVVFCSAMDDRWALSAEPPSSSFKVFRMIHIVQNLELKHGPDPKSPHFRIRETENQVNISFNS